MINITTLNGKYHYLTQQISQPYTINIIPYLWLHLAHGAVAATHDVGACAGEELRHPAETADEEAGVDEEEDEGGVTTRVLPVNHKRQLKQQTSSKHLNVDC